MSIFGDKIKMLLSGKPLSEVIVIPEVFGFSARLMGYKIRDYVTDGRIIASCQIQCQKQMGYDAVFAFADLSVEAEALGCKLSYEEDSYPAVSRPAVEGYNELKRLRFPDPYRDGRMPVIIEAVRYLRDAKNENCLIAACIMGPISLASQLMGLEQLIYAIVDSPEYVEKLLDFTTEVAISYGRALIEEGADLPIVFDPSASPLVVPPHVFHKFELPRLKRIYSSFKKAGASAAWISIAGNTIKILPYYSDAGIEIATIDYVVDLKKACQLSKGIVINGNLKPYLFVHASEEEVRNEVRRCLEDTRGFNRYILGSGCEIPIEAKPDNIAAMVSEARCFKP